MAARHFRRNPDGTRTQVEHEAPEAALELVTFGEEVQG